jgi:hypothetical protein
MTLDHQDLNLIQRAGIGQYRPMGDVVTARADRLVEAGLIARNPRTGIYFLLPAGADALAASDLAR